MKTFLTKLVVQHKNLEFLLMLLMLALVCLLPCSGEGENVQALWHDQQIFLNSLKEAIAGQSPHSVNMGMLGAGYVALGVIVVKALGIDPASGLVLINRVSFLITVLLFFKTSVILTSSVAEEGEPKNRFFGIERSIIFQYFVAFFYTAVVVLSANFVSFSDIPWTHFTATAILTGCFFILLTYLDRYRKKKISQYFWLCLLGISTGTLIQVRFFEGLVFLLSLFLCSLLSFIFNKRSFAAIRTILKNASIFTVFFGISSYFCLFFSGATKINMLYFTAAEHSPVMKEATKIYFDNFFLKFIQLFIDPNFFSLGQNYSPQPLIFGFSFEAWKMPLFMQVPVLLYSLPVTLGLFLFFVSKGRNGLKVDVIYNFFLPCLIGFLLILGYVSSAASGSPHLKYGFVRDFMAPTWFLCLASGPWVFYRCTHDISENSRRILLLGFPLIPLIISIFYGQLLIEPINLNQFHISEARMNYSCRKSDCSFSVDMYNAQGKKIQPLNERYIVSSFCPVNGKEIATTLTSKDNVFSMPSCPGAFEVNVIPVTTGFAMTPQLPDSLRISR